MTTPHTCPVCMGRGAVPPQPIGATMGNDMTVETPPHTECPACNGACVLWEPMPSMGTFVCAENADSIPPVVILGEVFPGDL